MTAPAATLPHAQAVVATLTGAGLTATLSQAGKDANGVVTAPPYVVVHVAPALTRSTVGSDQATLADPNRDAEVDFQTTCVGVSPEQALRVHDLTVTALLGASPTVAGRTTVKPVVFAETPGPVQRDDTGAEPLFYAVARWTWRTSA